MSPPRRRGANRQAAGQPGRQPARQQSRQQSRRRPATGRDFWGTDEPEDDIPAAITPSDDPAAMIASLGAPPIPGHETAALHYFDAVYVKAAGLAVALAAASGLLHVDDQDEPER